MQSRSFEEKKAALEYVTKIFPLVDLPFGILCVIFSENWIFTLCTLPVFHINAGTVLSFYAKYKFKNPGAYIFMLNGLFFFVFQYFSGHQAPGWGMLINITIGASFMFERERIGQLLLIVMAMLTGLFYWWLGATWEYSLIIFLVLAGMTALFARTYDYLQIQELKVIEKNKEIETKNKDITDSINYARKIQFAVLPVAENIQRAIPLHFIVYKPKDIVSGDFYWFHEINPDEYIIVCADCTGHGVPGAFMTVIGSNLLNQVVIENKIHTPGAILKELDLKMTSTLKQEKEKTLTVQDGMDCGILYVNRRTKEFVYSGAKRSAYFISDNSPQEIKSTKLSIGGLRSGEKNFDEHRVKFETDDILYMYTDGYVDQFGGDKPKKYSTKRLKDDLLKINEISLTEQKLFLEKNHESWKGPLEQLDDICLIGIRF